VRGTYLAPAGVDLPHAGGWFCYHSRMTDFFGRTEELAWLRRLWDECTTRDPGTGRFSGGPRMAFIIAESGIGKSRLVQAPYQQLTTDAQLDPPSAV